MAADMAAYNIKIETGTYIGTSSGTGREVTPICNGPDWALTKRITGTATVAYTLWRGMPRDKANSWAGAFASKPNQIGDLTRDGIYVGGGQNQTTAVYAYIAVKSIGNTYFQTGQYVGDAVDNRQLLTFEGTRFTPDWVGVHRRTDGNAGAFRTSAHTGDLAQSYTGIAAANIIQQLLPTGFEVGASPTSNNNGDLTDWYAMRAIPGGLAVGSFTGSGVAQSVNVGFAPSAVLVKNQATTDAMVILTAGMVTNATGSLPVTAAASDAQAITGLTSTGFTVGAAASCNGNGNKIIWIALKDGEYSLGRS